MTAPSDLIRRDTVEAMLRDRIAECDRTLARSRCAEDIEDATAERRELSDLVTLVAALSADPVAEAAGKLAASIGVPLVSCDYDTVCSVCHRTRDDLKESWARMTFTHAPDCAWETYRAAVAARDAGEERAR